MQVNVVQEKRSLCFLAPEAVYAVQQARCELQSHTLQAKLIAEHALQFSVGYNN
jgi:hypothetical protein